MATSKRNRPQHSVCTMPGDLDTARLVRSLADRQGAVVVDALATHKHHVTVGDLGLAVLRALGKSEHVNALKRKADPLALAWLCSLGHAPEAPRDARPLMVICEAQQLHPGVLETLRSWSAIAGIDLCLLVAASAPVDNPIVTETADWDTIEWAAVRDTLARRTVRRTPDAGSVPGWRVPRVDGIVFRTTCRDVLGDADFREVDAMFVDWVRSFRRSFRKCGNLAETWRYETVIRAAIESAPSTEELIVRVRAAQVAAETFGLVLTVDTVRLLAAAEGLCRRGLAGTQRWWEELDRYQDPDPGALAALYHAELNLDDAVKLSLSDLQVGSDSVTVDCGDRELVVDFPAARFLVVQRQYRLLCGADPDDPLFSTFRRPGMTKECAVNQLRLATAELGVDIIKGVLSTWHRNAPAYLARYGLRLHKALKAPNSPRDPERPVRTRRRTPSRQSARKSTP